MEILIAGRQEGKTTRLMHWLSEGVEIDKYPGWSRVVIVANRARHDYVRSIYWNEIDDFDHRVYTLLEIQQGYFSSQKTVYRLDDIDAFLSIFFPGINVDGFTITGSLWEANE